MPENCCKMDFYNNISSVAAIFNCPKVTASHPPGCCYMHPKDNQQTKKNFIEENMVI